MCQPSRNMPSSIAESNAARTESATPMASRPLDREAGDVLVGLLRIERLAHDREGLGRGRRRRETGLLHQLGGIGGEEHLPCDRLVVDVALDLAPALHLRQDPDREALPGEGIEIDAIGYFTNVAETVGEST